METNKDIYTKIAMFGGKIFLGIGIGICSFYLLYLSYEAIFLMDKIPAGLVALLFSIGGFTIFSRFLYEVYDLYLNR